MSKWNVAPSPSTMAMSVWENCGAPMTLELIAGMQQDPDTSLAGTHRPPDLRWVLGLDHPLLRG